MTGRLVARSSERNEETGQQKQGPKQLSLQPSHLEMETFLDISI